MSALEDHFALQMRAARLPAPEREFRFKPPRRWRFDFVFLPERVAVEVEGGTWTGGRHGTGVGMNADAEKYNVAALDGWLVIRVTTNMVRDGRALEFVRQALKVREGKVREGGHVPARDGK